MNKLLRKALLLTMALCLVLSCTFVSVFAAPANYSTEENSGERDEICTTFDGTSALDYYTGQYTYDNLSTLSESQLLASLRKLMTDTHKKITSYSECRDLAPITDCENENGSIVTIYSSYPASVSDYQSGQGWNREHVWPQSLGGFGTSGGGSDLHHIRPSESRINSTRGNHKYGETTGGSNVIGNLSSECGGYYSNGIFEPLDNVKGDVARICLYVYVRWGGNSSYTCNDLTKVFTDVETLLAWCELDPVDTWEMGRNEVVASIQGNRNVFIDYPELAWIMLGEEVPDNMTTPSGEANGGNTGSGSTDCTHSSTTLVNFESATCTENGYTGDVKCNNCKVIVTKGSVIYSKGHTYGQEVITKNPTETEDGIAEKTCSVCSVTVTVILPATGEIRPVEIVSNNVYYKDTLNLMYAVRALEGYDVALKIYDRNNNLLEIITKYNVEDVNGESLMTFTSVIGVPAQNIDTEFFAVAELSKDESVTATSSTKKYSVLEYLHERLAVSKNVTEEQKTLYKSILAYSDSADIVINEDTEDNINSYAYVRVENGTVDGSYNVAFIKEGEILSSLTSHGYVESSGKTLTWNVVCYNLGSVKSTASYTDIELKEGALTLIGGMSYVLTPTIESIQTTPKSYSYTFSSKQFSSVGTLSLGGVNWTLAGNGGFFGYDGTKGQQLGSANNPFKTMTLTSEQFTNVSKITVTTSGASSVNATLKVYVGGTLLKTITLTSTSTAYTIEVPNASGEIKLEYTQSSSKALYVKSIAVDYAE
ncbi:MAG: hypothetical protein E7673_06525 [Ruminococcaceae bacterium]|nr:hypothetical protein [Oscillospiraceae bacterium]